MLKWIAQRLTAYVFHDGADEDQRDICEYGCELWLYTVLSTVALLMVGAVLHFLPETMLMIAVFYTCQSNGGGYHAATHTKCFWTMVSGLVVGRLLAKVLIWPLAYYLILLISVLLLWIHPLYLHPNKQYMAAQKMTLVRKSRWATLVISAVMILLSIGKFDAMVQAGCIATALSTFSRLYALTVANKR